MSPSDLGAQLKPFVFLDLLEADMRDLAGGMPVHPHSGIATTTVFPEGDVTFGDPRAGHGTLSYGSVEWVRAGRGMWHGKELSAGTSKRVQGFQLWIALPPDLENAEPEAQYIGAEEIPTVGPAHLIVGTYEGAASPIRARAAINYLLVTLKPDECWTYEPPPGHVVSWVALAKGALEAGERLSEGELVALRRTARQLSLRARRAWAQPLFSDLPSRTRTDCTSAPTRSTRPRRPWRPERNIRELKQRLEPAIDARDPVRRRCSANERRIYKF